MTTTDYTAAALTARWHAEASPDVGGWRVTTLAGGIADLVLDQEVAEHIAGLHNARLAGISAFQATDEAAAALPAGATAVVVYGIRDADGHVHPAFDVRDAQAALTSPGNGPEPRDIVWWTVTTSPPAVYRPALTGPDPGDDCDAELHGAMPADGAAA